MTKIIAWTDVESGGTSPEVDSLLEVAVAFTDFSGTLLADPYSSLVSVKNIHKIMQEADSVVRSMHERSGLWGDLWAEDAKTSEQIDCELFELISNLTGDDNIVYFGGNSPILDRRYAEIYFPNFYKQISHMTVDVTTLSLVLQESGDAKMFHKRGDHRALSDVLDSIDEYRHYVKWISSN